MADLHDDPAIRSLLERMPEGIQNTFTDEQLVHLKIAIGARQWGNHAVDQRLLNYLNTVIYVLLAGQIGDN